MGFFENLFVGVLSFFFKLFIFSIVVSGIGGWIWYGTGMDKSWEEHKMRENARNKILDEKQLEKEMKEYWERDKRYRQIEEEMRRKLQC